MRTNTKSIDGEKATAGGGIRAEKLFRISFRSNFMAARDYLIAFGGIIYEIDIRRRENGREHKGEKCGAYKFRNSRSFLHNSTVSTGQDGANFKPSPRPEVGA